LATPTFLRDLPLASAALRAAAELHRGQRREVDDAPFVVHPLEVASLLYNMGYPDVVIAAGILHDTVEDTAAGIDDIERRFGEDVAALVRVMTEDPGIDAYRARKAALRQQIADFGPDATAVYAADKVAKVRELRAQGTCDPDVLAEDNTATSEKLAHYLASLEMLEEITPDDPLVRQLRFELETLQALPPRSG
jgi:(p)ppGpp synthase/HD superfamily hydrolase